MHKPLRLLLLLAASARGGPPALPLPGVPRVTAPAVAVATAISPALPQGLPIAINWRPPSVTLAWNASPSDGVTGYRLYYGSDKGTLSETADAGTNLILTIQLTPGPTYYFGVVAHDAGGHESPLSNEVSYKFPPAVNTLSNLYTSYFGPPGAVTFSIFSLQPSGQLAQIDETTNWSWTNDNLTASAQFWCVMGDTNDPAP
jgi:hypothetical protein